MHQSPVTMVSGAIVTAVTAYRSQFRPIAPVSAPAGEDSDDDCGAPQANTHSLCTKAPTHSAAKSTSSTNRSMMCDVNAVTQRAEQTLRAVAAKWLAPPQLQGYDEALCAALGSGEPHVTTVNCGDWQVRTTKARILNSSRIDARDHTHSGWTRELNLTLFAGKWTQTYKTENEKSIESIESESPAALTRP